LAQIFMFHDVLPTWTFARWVLAQALQSLDRPGRAASGRRTARAVEIAAELRGGLPSGDLESRAVSRLVDHDWVFRQVHLYELGGLQDFLRYRATPPLLEASDDLHAWAAAPMRGLQLVRHGRAIVIWRDLADGSMLEMPNNGCALALGATDFAIGRVVPTAGGQLFESAPLEVPERVARRVAGDPPEWVDALRSRTVEEIADGVEEFSVLHDVPTTLWRSVLTPDLATLPLSMVVAETARAALDRSRAELADLSRHHEAGSEDSRDIWPCLAAVMLDPEVAMVMVDVLRGDDVAVLRRLADVLADPAAALLRFATDDPRVA
jgi:hypothetical protein